jgi:hypothetical protein
MNENNECKLKADEQTAPLTEDLDLTYHTVRFNGSLMHENIYRQSASPEVDAAWEALGIDCTLLRSIL